MLLIIGACCNRLMRTILAYASAHKERPLHYPPHDRPAMLIQPGDYPLENILPTLLCVSPQRFLDRLSQALALKAGSPHANPWQPGGSSCGGSRRVAAALAGAGWGMLQQPHLWYRTGQQAEQQPSVLQSRRLPRRLAPSHKLALLVVRQCMHASQPSAARHFCRLVSAGKAFIP